jgi:dihydroorotate dehydrogenase electron transfer subunit
VGSAGVNAWVSLEEKMACGVGACLGCVVRIRDEDAGSHYEKACKEGPVFKASEVIFHEN